MRRMPLTRATSSTSAPVVQRRKPALTLSLRMRRVLTNIPPMAKMVHPLVVSSRLWLSHRFARGKWSSVFVKSQLCYCYLFISKTPLLQNGYNMEITMLLSLVSMLITAHSSHVVLSVTAVTLSSAQHGGFPTLDGTGGHLQRDFDTAKGSAKIHGGIHSVESPMVHLHRRLRDKRLPQNQFYLDPLFPRDHLILVTTDCTRN
jgi:hypothetical protein